MINACWHEQVLSWQQKSSTNTTCDVLIDTAPTAMYKYMLRGNTCQMPLIALTKTLCGGLTKSTANLHLLCNLFAPCTHFSLSEFSFQSCYLFTRHENECISCWKSHRVLKHLVTTSTLPLSLSLSLSISYTHIASQHKHNMFNEPSMKPSKARMTSTSSRSPP